MPFPIKELAKLPSAASATDKNILAPKIRELITAANELNQRLAILETPQEPEPQPTPTPPPAVASVTVSTPSPLEVGQTAQIAFTVKDAAGNVLVRPATFATDLTSVATVSPSGLITAVAAGSYSVTVTAEGVSGSASASVVAVPVPVPVPTPTPKPPTDAESKILALIGPTLSVTDTAALGADFKRYDEVFLEKLPPASADTWDNNYYDRAVAFYARYARTGDATFLQRAHNIALAYRQQYLEPNTYGTSPHWSQVRGLELHYRLTGDELSRKAVAGAFAQGLVSFSLPLWGDPKIPDLQNPQSAYMENRIQARVLQSALSAYRMGATYVRNDGFGGEYSPATWPTRLRDILNQILSVQNADGSFSWVQICGGQLNYMVGMLNDVLIEYYRDFEADPRIPIAVEKANEYLWATQWKTADQAFSYASVHCAPNPFGTNVGGTEAAGDLNGLLIASFGWLYSRTGDAKWRARGDAIMAGLVSDRWASNYTGSKQFNQAFAEAYRYLGWR